VEEQEEEKLRVVLDQVEEEQVVIEHLFQVEQK
jgi:hypothetical protein